MTRSARLLRATLIVSILAVASVAAAANNSEQVIFSGTGSGTFNGTPTPFGFWIWCEADSGNRYLGECHGAMYFYNLHIVQAVEDAGPGAVVENGEGLYSISVVDKKTQGTVVACTLTNHSDDSGPNNVIDVICSAPSGGTPSDATGVVNVTGP